MPTLWTVVWLLCSLIPVCSGVRLERRQDPLDSCTQTDLALLDACVASAIDDFLTSLDASQTSSFDYGAVASSINSIADGLTSYGVTLSSLPDPATFTGVPSTYSGPLVSDLVSGYSEYTATRTGTEGGGFEFDTTSFLATRSTTDSATTTSEAEDSMMATVSEGSTSQDTAAAASETPESSAFVLRVPTLIMGFCVSAIWLSLA